MSDLKQVNPTATTTQVEVFDNGTPLGVVPVSEDGTWSWVVNNLDDGQHSFTAKVVDTTVTSAAWRVSVPVLPRTEDFESNRRIGPIPPGTILSYPTMDLVIFGAISWGIDLTNNLYLPYLSGYVVEGRHSYIHYEKAMEYRFRRPVRHFRCGIYLPWEADDIKLRCYDFHNVEVATFEYHASLGYLVWAEVTSLESPIVRMDSYCSYGIALDNFTLDY